MIKNWILCFLFLFLFACDEEICEVKMSVEKGCIKRDSLLYVVHPDKPESGIDKLSEKRLEMLNKRFKAQIEWIDEKKLSIKSSLDGRWTNELDGKFQYYKLTSSMGCVSFYMERFYGCIPDGTEIQNALEWFDFTFSIYTQWIRSICQDVKNHEKINNYIENDLKKNYKNCFLNFLTQPNDKDKLFISVALFAEQFQLSNAEFNQMLSSFTDFDWLKTNFHLINLFLEKQFHADSAILKIFQNDKLHFDSFMNFVSSQSPEIKNRLMNGPLQMGSSPNYRYLVEFKLPRLAVVEQTNGIEDKTSQTILWKDPKNNSKTHSPYLYLIWHEPTSLSEKLCKKRVSFNVIMAFSNFEKQLTPQEFKEWGQALSSLNSMDEVCDAHNNHLINSLKKMNWRDERIQQLGVSAFLQRISCFIKK